MKQYTLKRASVCALVRLRFSYQQIHAGLLEKRLLILNKNSIPFNGYILKGGLNNTTAYYKARTKTHMKHKKNTNIQKQNTKQTKQKYCGERLYKRLRGPKRY
jgi:hypothetical protein